jgi:hypothetical protein
MTETRKAGAPVQALLAFRTLAASGGRAWTRPAPTSPS